MADGQPHQNHGENFRLLMLKNGVFRSGDSVYTKSGLVDLNQFPLPEVIIEKLNIQLGLNKSALDDLVKDARYIALLWLQWGNENANSEPALEMAKTLSKTLKYLIAYSELATKLRLNQPTEIRSDVMPLIQNIWLDFDYATAQSRFSRAIEQLDEFSDLERVTNKKSDHRAKAIDALVASWGHRTGLKKGKGMSRPSSSYRFYETLLPAIQIPAARNLFNSEEPLTPIDLKTFSIDCLDEVVWETVLGSSYKSRRKGNPALV